MIWSLHYILFNAGLSAILILLTLFLQTYSDASLTEIGTLLMVLPFLSIIAKPLFCALADRQQAHKKYLMGSLFLMGTGYGSLAIAPFYPQFIEQHGRLVWYLDVVGIVIGFTAFGVAWSLGDALAVYAAQVNGVPWGSYRAWATASWGVFGMVVGQINETPYLPKYVPGFLVLSFSCAVEIILLALWPNSAFDMTGADEQQQQQKQVADKVNSNGFSSSGRHQSSTPPGSPPTDLEMNDFWFAGGKSRPLNGTLSGSARSNPRLMGAMANVMMEEVGSSLRNSLKLGQPQKRVGLSEILEQHQLSNASSPVIRKRQSLASTPSTPLKTLREQYQQQHQQQSPSPQSPQSPIANRPPMAPHQHLYQQHDNAAQNQGTFSKASTFGKSALRRTQLALSRMNSLSSASGHAIADELNYHSSINNNNNNIGATCGTPTSIHKQIMLSSLAGGNNYNASLGRTAATRALGLSQAGVLKEIPDHDETTATTTATNDTQKDTKAVNNFEMLTAKNQEVEEEKSQDKYVEDLQIILLKLIVKRDISVVKYLLLFTIYGILFTIHIAYFFMHVEQLCREKGYGFAGVMGSMTMAHSISEVFCFLVIVPNLMPRLGRFGSMLAIVLIFTIRYSFYGTYFIELSPYVAVITETCHGFAYGLTYSLIMEIAVECVNQVDAYLPELVERGIVDPEIHPNELKLPLRATMYGLFSGAFDGLGNGLGALIAGIYLDSHPFKSLWLLCTYISIAIVVIYPLTEWRYLCGKSSPQQQQQQKLSSSSSTLSS